MPRFGNRIYIWQAGAYENCEFKMARIMVVDDNDDVRKLTSRILEADGSLQAGFLRPMDTK
jgi:hypothetical protein